MRKKYKRRADTYSKVANLQDTCCSEILAKQNGSAYLSNPFKPLKGDERTTEVYEALGSNEKILGILQCFEFFQPQSTFFLLILVTSGLKHYDEKNTESNLKGSLDKMSKNLKTQENFGEELRKNVDKIKKA